MKKTLAVLVLSIAFLAPSFSYAQTASQDEIRDQYQATLVQLINLLQQQVQILMGQLADLKDKQDILADDVKTVKTNTTPTGTAPDTTILPQPHKASWSDTKDPYYQNGLVYIETTIGLNTAEARVVQLHKDGAQSISLSFVGKQDEGDGYTLYSFSPDSNLGTGSYNLSVLRFGHSLEYDEKGVPEYDYSIRLDIQ